jgi:chlorophyllide a oxygenase
MSSAAARALLGAWDAAIPISVAFEPPCMVLSTLRLNHPTPDAGWAAGLDTQPPVSPSPSPSGVAASTSRLLHQVHVVIPGENGTSRVLYRLAINWAGTLLTLGPGAPALWRSLAEEVVREQMASVPQGEAVRGSSAASGAYAAWRASVAGGGAQQAAAEA